MNSQMPNNVEDLVVGHFEGSLTTEQEQKLASVLSHSEEGKQLFLSYMRLEGRLHSLGRDGLLREPDPPIVAAKERPTPRQDSSGRPQRINARALRILASLAVCFVAMATISWLLTTKPVSANAILEKAQRAAAELMDRSYRLVISNLRTENERGDREVEISLRGGGKFLVQPENGIYVMGFDGSEFWLARKAGFVAVTSDYQSLSSELTSRIPNRRLLEFLSAPQQPLLLDLESLLKRIRESYDVELVESESDEFQHLRGTLRKGEPAVIMPIIDLWIDTESGVFVKAELVSPDKRSVRIELLESRPLPEDWYRHEYHFPDHKVRRLNRDSR